MHHGSQGKSVYFKCRNCQRVFTPVQSCLVQSSPHFRSDAHNAYYDSALFSTISMIWWWVNVNWHTLSMIPMSYLPCLTLLLSNLNDVVCLIIQIGLVWTAAIQGQFQNLSFCKQWRGDCLLLFWKWTFRAICHWQCWAKYFYRRTHWEGRPIYPGWQVTTPLPPSGSRVMACNRPPPSCKGHTSWRNSL